VFSVDPDHFRYDPTLGAGVRGRRVFITGSGKNGGLGQAFALAAGLNGAESVGVHFHRSAEDGFDLVAALRGEGVNAFPVQADVTNFGDLWATRSYVIEQMGGRPPDLVICNSGLTEAGYSFGRALREVEDETLAMRRARVRQHFLDALSDSRLVIDTKVDGFLASTHLWAGEALHHGEALRLVYVSSRQAVDPGRGVPGYAISNWAVLQLPEVLAVNLGRQSKSVCAFSILLPFVRTGMTGEYADNEKVFGRWQPRMLETHEAAEAFLRLLAQSDADLARGMFQLNASADPSGEGIEVAWEQLQLEIAAGTPAWCGTPLRFR
jgi:NAD(P)-dependent dehydrogenase (short-subunit alcohol dehydrogenase family)